MLLLWFPWNLKKIENHGFYNTGEITNHGVIIADTTKGKCLKFNGSQYLGMDLPIGSMNCPLTVAWWCYWNTTNAYKAIISSRTLTGAGLSIWGSGDNHIRFDNGNNTNDTTQLHLFSNHTFAKTDGLWYHYVVIQDDTTRKLYVNGTLVQTIAQNNITGNTATTMLIGASAASDSINPNANYMNGYIGDLRIYNEALSADRIAKIAAGALSAPPLQNHKQLELWMPLRSNANNYSINNITATPTAITYAAGRTGLNAVFNGRSSVIKTDFAWRPTTGWTIAGWVKLTNLTGKGTVVRSTTKYSPVLDFYGSTTSGVRLFYWQDSGNTSPMIEGFLPTVNKWTHYVGTWDGQTLKLYIDGVLYASQASATPIYNTGNIEFGYCDATSSALSPVGQMADLRLYNYALSESEIYELSLARVGHWMLNGMQMTAGDKTEYDGEQGKKGTANNALQGRKNTASPRYLNCFMANGSYIKLPAVPYSGVIDEFSYNVWAYAPAWTSAAFGSAKHSGIFNCVENGGWGLHWTKSGSILSCWFHNGSSYVGPNVVSTNLSNGWHMITATTNGTDINIYVDAVLIANSSGSKFTINQKNTPFIGYECSGSSPYSNGQFKGNISEIELFAKYLTAEDVAKRYQKAHIPT